MCDLAIELYHRLIKDLRTIFSDEAFPSTKPARLSRLTGAVAHLTVEQHLLTKLNPPVMNTTAYCPVSNPATCVQYKG